MSAVISEGQVVSTAWILLSWAFLIAAFGGALLISKARARGRRLFRDEPLARVRALKADHSNDHIWDA